VVSLSDWQLTNDPATVYVVDSDPAVASLIDGLSADLSACCQAYGSPEEFLAAGCADRPGCLVTEFRLPGMSGIELLDALSRQSPALPVVFLTAYAEVPLVVKVMQNGAVTVIEKPPSWPELWDGIRQAIARDTRNWQLKKQRDQLQRRLDRITPDERQVLDLIMSGKPNKAIAHQLEISVRTVESRRHQIFRKTRASSVAELVRMVLRVDSGDDPRLGRH
jgi:RNA polymerase sigma factor (sigma-70 family)